MSGSMSELRCRNYFRNTFGNCVTFTFGNYVIKPCKWDQKTTQVLRLEVTSEFRNKVTVELCLEAT